MLKAFILTIFLLGHVPDSFAMGSKSSDADEKDIPTEVVTPEGKVSANSPQGNSPSGPEGEAKIKEMIVVLGPYFKGRESFARAEVLKIAIDEIIKTDNYELIFSRPKNFREAGFDYKELVLKAKDVSWGQNKKGYDLSFQLVNGKSGRVIKRASQKRVPDKRMLFYTRLLLYKLFYGDKLARKKTKDLIKKDKANESKEPPPETQKSNEAKEEPTPQKQSRSEEEEEELPSKSKKQKITNNKKKKKKKRRRVPPFSPSPIDREEQDPEANKVANNDDDGGASGGAGGGEGAAGAKKSKPNKEDLPTPTPPEETPEELSRVINEEIERIKASYIAAKKNPSEAVSGGDKDDERKKEEEKKKAQEQAQVESVAQAVEPKRGIGGSSLKSKKEYSFGFDVIQQDLTSTQSIIVVSNSFRHMGIKAAGNVMFRQDSKDAMTFKIRITRVVGGSEDQQFEVPGMTQLGLGYRFSFFDGTSFFKFRPYAGVEYETQAFVTLVTEGSGLEISKSKILWYKLGGQMIFTFGDRRLKLDGALYNAFIASTEFGGSQNLNMNASKIFGALSMEVFKKTFIQLSYSSSVQNSLAVTQLENKQTLYALSAIYEL